MRRMVDLSALHRIKRITRRHEQGRPPGYLASTSILPCGCKTRAAVGAPADGEPELLPEPLTDSETRVLRYLPTNLSAAEIAAELYVSVHTVKPTSATSVRSWHPPANRGRRAGARPRPAGGFLAQAVSARPSGKCMRDVIEEMPG